MRDSSLLLQSMLNTPLAVSEQLALMLNAVFQNKLNIREVLGPTGERYGREELETIAAQGRHEADAKRARSYSDQGYTSFKRSECGRIAVIDVVGVLTRTWGVGTYSGTTGYDGIKIQADDAIEEKSIRALWFNHDSGGGAVNGMMDLSRYLASLREEFTGKRLFGMAADYSFSAAYGLLSACDEIFCPQGGSVGSIGTIGMYTSFKRMLQDEGIDVEIIRSPDRKAKPHPCETMDDESRRELQAEIDELTSQFQSLVATNRAHVGLTKKNVAATRGRTYTGEDAKALGLVDAVVPEHIAWAMVTEYLDAQEGK